MTLTQDDLIELRNYANELPTKYGATLLIWLGQKEQAQRVVIKEEVAPNEDGK